jgi:hypothetical protein
VLASAATISDMMDVGPTVRSREVPKRKYMKVLKNAE